MIIPDKRQREEGAELSFLGFLGRIVQIRCVGVAPAFVPLSRTTDGQAMAPTRPNTDRTFGPRQNDFVGLGSGGEQRFCESPAPIEDL